MAQGKPNILVLWGDDIGWWNISYNSRGQMGYRTPNIDRIANEGVAFTDYYGQQSCTAGRAAFITGQNPIRTGLTKVGMPGGDVGLRAEDPTIAELLKPQGYVTGQFRVDFDGPGPGEALEKSFKGGFSLRHSPAARSGSSRSSPNASQ